MNITKNSLFKYRWRTKKGNRETKPSLTLTNPQDPSSNIAGTLAFTNSDKFSTVDIFPKIEIFLYHFRVKRGLEFHIFKNIEV